jgi:hypothetical protein
VIGSRGTVREDYSLSGDASDYSAHDQARSQAYRWGEDGLAGISDDHQQLCFALAHWRGQVPILKGWARLIDTARSSPDDFPEPADLPPDDMRSDRAQARSAAVLLEQKDNHEKTTC